MAKHKRSLRQRGSDLESTNANSSSIAHFIGQHYQISRFNAQKRINQSKTTAVLQRRPVPGRPSPLKNSPEKRSATPLPKSTIVMMVGSPHVSFPSPFRAKRQTTARITRVAMGKNGNYWTDSYNQVVSHDLTRNNS